MALVYILAGIMHFVKPKAYLRVMPPYFPNHRALVALSGLAEILLGAALCFSITKNYAIMGVILMLLIFLTVHVHMLKNEKAASGIPRWILIIRIPLQFALIYWAYWYLKI